MSPRFKIAQTAVALVACVAVSTAIALGVRAAAAAPSSAAASAHPDGALLSKYCFACHNSKSRAGGLALDAKDVANVGADAETWEKVIRKLQAGAMPPVGRPRPDQQTADAFVEALEAQLDKEAALH
ncbi:MAG TPA: c-type cytochrome domain-containing protein, partial [Caulobacterales bacterium]|nr:c-type cytochrome domain-containing protein [Caulobacterales bacterium]